MPNYEHARYPYDHEQFDDNQHEQTRNRRKRNRGRFSNTKRSFSQVRRLSVRPLSGFLAPAEPALLNEALLWRSSLLWQVKKSNERTNSRRTAAGRAASYQRSKAAKQQRRQAEQEVAEEDLGVPIPRPDGTLPRPPQPPRRQPQPQILRIMGDATGAAAGCVYPLLHVYCIHCLHRPRHVPTCSGMVPSGE